MNANERRRSFRYRISIPVGIQFPRGVHREGWGRILNISPEGLMIETRFSLRVGDVIYATFSMADGSNFENLRARIVRSVSEDGYYIAGMAFDEVVDLETLRDVIASLAHEGLLQVD